MKCKLNNFFHILYIFNQIYNNQLDMSICNNLKINYIMIYKLYMMYYLNKFNILNYNLNINYFISKICPNMINIQFLNHHYMIYNYYHKADIHHFIDNILPYKLNINYFLNHYKFHKNHRILYTIHYLNRIKQGSLSIHYIKYHYKSNINCDMIHK